MINLNTIKRKIKSLLPERLKSYIINDSGKRYFIFFILALNLIINLLFRYNFKIPYGNDEIITIWPIGTELVNSKILDWPSILFSRFLSEDHLFPVTNFFTYFICKLNGDIIENLYWIARFCYVLILILSILLIKNIGFTYSNIIIFTIIFLNAGPLNFGILSYNFNFNLVCILSLLTLIFYIKPQKQINIFLFFLFSFLGTFTSENFYIIYPIILIIFIFQKIKNVHSRSWVVLIFFLAILGLKFLVSLHFIGTIMPASRLQLLGGGVFINILGVLYQLFNSITFGISHFFLELGKIWFFLSLLLFSFYVFLYVKKNKEKKDFKLIYLFLAIVPFIGYTGRFHPGMWTFVELIGIAIISKIILFSFDFKKYPNYLLLFICLFFINQIIEPYWKLKSFLNTSNENSNLAYTLIKKGSERIVLYNLTDGSPTIHPIVFWLGSKIYNKQQGLIYKKNERSFHMYDIDMEIIKLDTEESIRNLKVTSNNNVTTLVNTKNAFIKIKYLDRLISEYAISDKYKKNNLQEYDIINPFFNQNNLDKFSVNIISNDFIASIPDIKLNTSTISNLKKYRNSIKFDFVSSSLKDKLILKNINFKIKNILISNHSQNKPNCYINEGMVIISDKNSFYKLSNSNLEIIGNIQTNKKKYLETKIASLTSTKMNIQFWYYNPRLNNWDSFTVNNQIIYHNTIINFNNNKIFLTNSY